MELLNLNRAKESSLHLAHQRCTKHRAEIEQSAMCGCFYCLSTLSPSEIREWTDDGQTAICPKCALDSVIGSESAYPITPEFLRRMHDHWF
jgi:hypothetical protein